MSNNNNANSGGIGFLGLLQILFIGLKLTNHIDWSWFWVLSPIIGVFGIIMIVLILAIIAAVIK